MPQSIAYDIGQNWSMEIQRHSSRIAKDASATIECDQRAFVIPEHAHNAGSELARSAGIYHRQSKYRTLYTLAMGNKTSLANRLHVSFLSCRNAIRS